MLPEHVSRSGTTLVDNRILGELLSTIPRTLCDEIHPSEIVLAQVRGTVTALKGRAENASISSSFRAGWIWR